jgi:hypothetical protein
MLQVEFEPMIPLFERAKTVLALDRAATVVCLRISTVLKMFVGVVILGTK